MIRSSNIYPLFYDLTIDYKANNFVIDFYVLSMPTHFIPNCNKL